MLDELCAYGSMAPTAGNERCLEFFHTIDKTLIQKCADIWQGRNEPVTNAHSMILICCNVKKCLARYQGCYVEQATGAATENILLAAHAAGLGACAVGVPREIKFDVAKIWDEHYVDPLHEKYIPMVLITVGYLE